LFADIYDPQVFSCYYRQKLGLKPTKITTCGTRLAWLPQGQSAASVLIPIYSNAKGADAGSEDVN
jgi:hypothetical protein